jgi:Xaa-Pro aminopeptidase
MILSNEPGYYKPGDFGIRTENLILVEPRAIPGAEGDYFGFETLTFAPIDRTLVDCALLTQGEVNWWNAYHAKVVEVLLPQLAGEVRAWVEAACAPL